METKIAVESVMRIAQREGAISSRSSRTGESVRPLSENDTVWLAKCESKGLEKVMSWIVRVGPDIMDLCTDEEAICSESPTMNCLCEFMGKQRIIAWLMAQLEDLNWFFGKRIKMDSQKQETTAKLMLRYNCWMTPPQMVVFFFWVKAGKFKEKGEFYGSEIDPNKLMTLLNIFHEDINRIRYEWNLKKEREERSRVNKSS